MSLDKKNKKSYAVRTWIEVDKKKLAHNYKIFRKLIGKKIKLLAVSKSNAYGHGLIDYSREVEKLGVDWIGVDSVLEALKLRKNNIKKPILVLGYTMPELIEEAIKNNISLTISSLEVLESLKKIKSTNLLNKLKIHLKIDTGMSRQGFFIEDLKNILEFIKNDLAKIKIEGIFTHLAAVSNKKPKETLLQLKKFDKAIKIIESFGYNPIKHVSATSGTIVFPEAHYDLVRVGIGLYGLWPSLEIKKAFAKKINLKPILTWKTIISEIKDLKIGDKVGYDFTEIIKKPTKVAVLPIGYWHGYDRRLSSLGYVLIKNKKARVIGRISMDIIVVDVTNIKNIKINDEVILLGDKINADYLADLMGTVNYEVITRLNPLIKKIYV